MARAEITDPLMSHNFALIEIPVAAEPGFITAFTAKLARSLIINRNYVSFQSISMPTVDIRMKEIKEGNWPMTRYVPMGSVSSGQVTITHAVFPEGVDMFLWARQAIFGIGAPKRDLLVVHFGIDKLVPRRIIKLSKCIPVNWKSTTDLDAMSPSVALEELVLQVEDVDFLI